MKRTAVSTHRKGLPEFRAGGRVRQFLTGLLAGFSGLNAVGGPAAGGPAAGRPAVGGPHGMQVQQGTVNATQNGSRLDITASHNSVINWKGFNIAAGESVNFRQPNAVSVVWNRILDSNPSQIWGSLSGNGIVVLMNQNGFYFGPNSSINVGGGFIATTVPVAPTSPIGGGMWQYSGMPPLASIINYGEIKVGSGGSLFMIAEKIENHGVLSAPDGTLGLYAGKEVLLSERPDGRGLSASVRLPEGSIDNTGKLIADGGTIAMHAQVVNNNGLAQANSVREHNGAIEFLATEKVELGPNSILQARGDVAGVSDGGRITIQSAQTFSDQAGSKIDVTGGAQGGNGGAVELSAPLMSAIHSELDGRAAHGWAGGQLFLDPTDIILTSAADASSDPSGTINAGDAPGDTLRLNVNSAFANFAQIHLQATHDISLEQGTIWNLNESTGISDPGSKLTLEAGHDIIFADSSRIVGGPGWSLQLSAGVDFASPTLAVTPGAGSIYFNGGAPDANGAKPNGTGAIETSDGSISLAAGHDILVGGGFVRTTGGGNISLTTGDGDVDAGTKADTYAYPSAFRYQISVAGLGGIGTAGGGNLSIDAGRDILAFIGSIGAFGMGNVDLTAGRDIKGRFMLRNGLGNVVAGRDIGSDSSPVSLGLVIGGWTLNAVRDLTLNEVYNPNGALNSRSFLVNGVRVPFLFDYAPDAFVSLTAGNAVQLLGNDIAHGTGNGDRPVIYPPRLSIDAGAGGVVLGNDLILAPSPLGSLSLHTTDGGSLSSAAGGFFQFVMSDSGSPSYTDFASGHKTGTPLHFNSGDAGVNLDIAGDVRNVFLRLPRQSDITIHGNAINFSFEGQNLAAGDVTTLRIGGDFTSRSDRTFASVATDPKLLDTIFNPFNTRNPELAARIQWKDGRLEVQGILRSSDVAFLLAPEVYRIDPQTQLLARDMHGLLIVDPAPPIFSPAVINDLFVRSQDIPNSPLARNGLQIGGPGSLEIAAHNMDLGISAGIRSVGVQLNHALAAITYLGASIKLDLGGNLEMASSQIASFSGGDVDVTAGGRMDVGSTQQFTSDDTPKGIYTGHGGHVNVRASGDIDINGSRIATYDGGDISVVSVNGSIDAGQGGKGFFNVTTTQFDPETGLPVDRNDKFFGSGIVALTRVDGEARVGDILVSAGLMNEQVDRDTKITKGIGSIQANAGGVLQLAFNKVDQSASKVELFAKGDIKANQSGILGNNVTLNAGGDIDGLVVAQGNLGITSQQSVSVTALAGGTANVTAAGNVSGTVIGGGGATVGGGGSVDATVISTGGGGGAFANVAAPVSTQTVNEAEKKAVTAANDSEDEEEKKRRAAAKAPVLSKTSGRVTVILPNK